MKMSTMCVLGLAVLFSTGRGLPAAEPVRALFVTQSKGFRHGSVNRRQKNLAPAEIAMTQLGQQTKLFTVDCTQDLSLIHI